MTFIQHFLQRADVSFRGMRNTAIEELKPYNRSVTDRLYDELRRGTQILDDEDHLNMYLRAFGNMHKAKLDAAFSFFKGIDGIFNQPVSIFDWGCGQGTATICLLDFLRQNSLLHLVGCITLVEPSVAAVARAQGVISAYGAAASVKVVSKVFDELQLADFSDDGGAKLHLFSNILDVSAFNLARFTHLFQSSFSGLNYFVCVGPLYSNNKRVDEFMAAISPDSVFASVNKQKDDADSSESWTMALRMFSKNVKAVEDVMAIGRRIEDFHKHQQLFAGYVLDCVDQEIRSAASPQLEAASQTLLKALSAFDVRANVPLDFCQDDCDPKMAVLANIISRGLPTKAPILLEEAFASSFGLSSRQLVRGSIGYRSTGAISAQAINEALHVIDPRFRLDAYNGDMLESPFEKDFIFKFLAQGGAQYLAQVLEPQRPLSSIVSLPNGQFSKDQRVDFALEVPGSEANAGFVLELDGFPYHSNIFQRVFDHKRDVAAARSGWQTSRISHLLSSQFIANWECQPSSQAYLATLKKNFGKTISGEWCRQLQAVLSPLAVARVQRVLVQALMAGVLKPDAQRWSVAVVERDVPCAALAIEDFKNKYRNICLLAGQDGPMPEVELVIVSTPEFIDSPLHLGHSARLSGAGVACDLCIDVSMLLRDGVDALPLNVEAAARFIVRSSHYQKQERIICTTANIQYPPFVSKNADGTYQNIALREQYLTYFLQDIFRKEALRNGQLPILSHILADKTTIGLLPTGGGKSLTYQLACMLQPGVTVVVDPLVSLMVDQVRGLRDVRIDACDCVIGSMEREEKAQKLALLQNGALQFMFLSPERFMMQNFRESLLGMTELNHVYFSYGVIDEVHCVSEWGHDFRTSYLHLGRNMITYMHTKAADRKLAVIGLTATASFDVLADVERELTMGGKLSIDSEAIVRPEDDERPELTYRIVQVDANFSALRSPSSLWLNVASEWDLKTRVANVKRARLKELIAEVPADLLFINNANEQPACQIAGFSPDGFFQADADAKFKNAGIVFCPHAKGNFGVNNSDSGKFTGISNFLCSNEELSIGRFVGGDNPGADMASFNQNDLNVMVATKAFGMGIDKPNIRFTVNMNHPSSIESFVQEAGRAGRDKKNAISYVLFEPTSYVQFTADKLNDIRYSLVQAGFADPVWLEAYRDRFVLENDLTALCALYDGSPRFAAAFVEYVRSRRFIENVDKDIILWFHNNSFRGLLKERVIIHELTDCMLNVASCREEGDFGSDDVNGIYQAVAKTEPDGYSYITVSWENVVNKDSHNYNLSLINEVDKIAQATGWKSIDSSKAQYENLSSINDFDELLQKISRLSNDTNWVRYQGEKALFKPLRRAFCVKRDKADTDKAIYRLCCVGLVDDVTADYNTQTYELKILNRSDDEYRQIMVHFFHKYYSLEKAEEKVRLIDAEQGRSYLEKCLWFLTGFVYTNLESKRIRAIDDMRMACTESVAERRISGNDKWIKEFVHLYFNSKYNRTGYTINGDPYSLKEDTDGMGNDGFDLVLKYIAAMTADDSGSEVENVKHLYGATLLSLRAHTDNAALKLLLCYCIVFLGVHQNQDLRTNAFNAYIEGFMTLHHNGQKEVLSLVDEFNSLIENKIHEDDGFFRDELIQQGRDYITFLIHEENFTKIKEAYLQA